MTSYCPHCCMLKSVSDCLETSQPTVNTRPLPAQNDTHPISFELTLDQYISYKSRLLEEKMTTTILTPDLLLKGHFTYRV